MLIIGTIIGEKISDHQQDKVAVYQKALKIKDDTEIFKYAMSTNVGNSLIEGDLFAVDPVSYPEIEGEYLAIEKVKERYVMKTRTVTYTDSKGKTKTKTETYWEWDVVGRENKSATTVNFVGVDFPISKFSFMGTHHLTTLKESSHVRYKYYVYPSKVRGTIFNYLADNSMRDKATFHEETIEEYIDSVSSNLWIILFWIFWLPLTGFLIYQFCYLDNDWLNN